MSLSDDLRYLIEYDILKVKRILRGLIAELPQSFEARILLGDTHLRALEFDAAIAQFRAALAIQPNSRMVVAKLALCAIYTGNYEAALHGFERLHRAGRDEQALVLAGVLLHRLGRREAALERFAAFRAGAAADSQHFTFALQSEIRALRAAGRVDAADEISARLMEVLAARPLDAASDLHRRSSSYDFHEWSWVADKGRLAWLLAHHADTGSGDLRFPPSFVMPDERGALAAYAARQDAGAVYVVKPRGGQGGQSIRLAERVEEALAAEDAVVQRYIHPPYLVQGRKAHLRIYCLITSADPLRFYVHDDGIVRFAPRPYGQEDGWLERVDMHITNTALHRKNPLLQLSQDAAVENVGHIWSLKAYLRQVAADGHDGAAVFAAIGRMVGRFVLTLRAEGFFARQGRMGEARGFAAKLFGFDVLLDAQARPWLIEIQRSPAWTGPPLVGRINGGVAEAMVRMMSGPLLGDDVGVAEAAAIRSDPAALARREQVLEGRLRGGFVRIVHDAVGETDAARGGREIVL